MSAKMEIFLSGLNKFLCLNQSMTFNAPSKIKKKIFEEKCVLIPGPYRLGGGVFFVIFFHRKSMFCNIVFSE